MAIVRVGIDIATTVFQVHGVDAHGKTKLKKMLSRSEMLDSLPGCRHAWSALKPVPERTTGQES